MTRLKILLLLVIIPTAGLAFAVTRLDDDPVKVANSTTIKVQTTTIPKSPSTTNAPVTTRPTSPPTTRTRPTTTTTSAPENRASRSNEQTRQIRSVTSTAYCLRGKTAHGERGYEGSVAIPREWNLLGTTWRVLSGPQAGKVLRANDHTDYKTQFDIWMSSCSAAINYGRHFIQIERVT